MAAKVFDVVEMLEHVLLDLPMLDLLLAQRVNKQFKSTIEGSMKIQQALFFTPVSDSGDPSWAEVTLNPLLCFTYPIEKRCAAYGEPQALFVLTVRPQALHRQSSAWRMLRIQPPKVYLAYAEKG